MPPAANSYPPSPVDGARGDSPWSEGPSLDGMMGGPVGGTPLVNGNGHANGHTNGFANGGGHTNGLNNAAHRTPNGHPPSIPRSPTTNPIPIAITGMAVRLPDISHPLDFWELLARARGTTGPIPSHRFSPAPFHHPNPDKAGCLNPTAGSFLTTDLARFDAPFFSLTEKEAISMDPQQRMLLECTFEALESAGIPKADIVGEKVGVFIGGSFPEYESALFRDTDTIPMHQATGKDSSRICFPC
ncbi:hypothetical protein VUR80DRAFT_8050 [Thermomyces stellatus]